MPALVSLPILDGNGDGIIDGTSINIQEAVADAVIVGGVIVAILAAPEITAALLLDLIGTAILDILALHEGGGVIPQTVLDKIDDIDEIIQTWQVATGTDHQKLEVIRSQLNDIHAAYPPTWPSGTPSWYTAPGPGGATAQEIWEYDPTIQPNMISIMRWLNSWRVTADSSNAWPIPAAPGFLWFGNLTEGPSGNAVVSPPAPDWTDILDTDTRLTWLQRTDTSNTWVDDFLNGEPTAVQVTVGAIPLTWCMCAFSEREFQAMRLAGVTSGQVAAVKADTEAILAEFPITIPPVTVATTTPPVWPGIGLVTLGTPVALVDGLVVDGPMDGCLVDVTTAPTRVGQRVIGGKTFDYNSGEMTFGTDDGYLEPWVYTGFRTAIFTPKTMQRAAHAYFRVLAGAAGTVTPWSRTV